MNDIQNKIAQLWDFVLRNEKIDANHDSKFIEALNKIEEKSVKECLEFLEPFISIFTEGIQWLSNLHIVLTPDLYEETKIEAKFIPPYLLIGTACTYAVAIRRLVLSGLDYSAKILLRSLMETLNICTLIIADISISYKFNKAEDQKTARHLWLQEFSKNKIEQVLSKIESQVGFNGEYMRELKTWRLELSEMMSQFVHPTSISSFLTALPISLTNPTYCVPNGVLGSSNCLSIRTLAIGCKLIWYFSVTALPLLMKLGPNGEPPQKLSIGDKNGAAVLIGAEIFEELIIEYTNDYNFPDIFAEDKQTTY